VHGDIYSHGIFIQFLRSRWKGCTAKGAGLKDAVLPQIIDTLLVKLMFAGKGAQSLV
jgi:hypothetical protein